MNKIIAVLALVIAAATQVADAKEPSSYETLKPFRAFKKGEGEGVAYHYMPRTKAQFVALLRSEAAAKKEMRLGCKILVQQIAEAHDLRLEGCEGAAAEIENNSDYSVIACEDRMFTSEGWLVVTSPTGTEFGVWHRKCLKGEMVLVYKNQPIISMTCLNVVVPVRQQTAEQCANVHITVPSGSNRSVRSTLVRREPVPDFDCWGVIEREWRTGAPRNCDWCEWTEDGVLEMVRRYGGDFRFYHTSIYTMHKDTDDSGKPRATEVVLVFPLAARDGGVAVCVEVDGKIFEAALVLPPTWKENGTRVTIPADFWVRPRVVD